MASSSSSNSANPANSKPPTLTSLPKPALLQVISLLDATSLEHLRLTNKFLNCIVNETITSITYGTKPPCCSPAEVEYVAERFPSIKIIKVCYLARSFSQSENDTEELSNAMECLRRAKWTAIEEVKFPKARVHGNVVMNISGAQALAACTVSWGRLRKLKMQHTVGHEGLDVLATHGDFPSLEKLDLTGSNFTSHKTLAGAALAKFVSRTPKLCTLKLRHCPLGEGFFPLFETELPSLEIINLESADIDDNILSKLNPEKWPGLSTLVLKRNSFSANGFATLLRKNWEALKHFDLISTAVGSEGIDYLAAAAAAGRLPSLTSLSVDGFAGISLETFAFACGSNLERLEIDGGEFRRDEMARFIAAVQAQRFPALRSLTLLGCQFKEDAWAMLLSIIWDQIEELTMDADRLAYQHFADFGVVLGNFFPKVRVLTFKNSKDGHRELSYISRSAWNQVNKSLFRAPWPSLMRVDFKKLDLDGPGKLPEIPLGWKVTKSEYRKFSRLERVGTSETLSLSDSKPTQNLVLPPWIVLLIQTIMVQIALFKIYFLLSITLYSPFYLLKTSIKLQARYAYCSWTISPGACVFILTLIYAFSVWLNRSRLVASGQLALARDIIPFFGMISLFSFVPCYLHGTTFLWVEV